MEKLEPRIVKGYAPGSTLRERSLGMLTLLHWNMLTLLQNAFKG